MHDVEVDDRRSDANLLQLPGELARHGALPARDGTGDDDNGQGSSTLPPKPWERTRDAGTIALWKTKIDGGPC